MLTRDQVEKYRLEFGITTPTGSSLTPAEPEQPGFFSRIKEAFVSRNKKAIDARDKAERGEQNRVSSFIQGAGQGAGFIGDVAAEALKAVLPDVAEDKIAELSTRLAQAKPVQEAMASYEKFKTEHPEAAANLEATGLLASIFPVAKAGQVGTKVAAQGAKKAGAVAREGVDITGRGVEKTGQKIQQTVIRPSQRDIEDGFKIENVAKYDLGGSLPQTVAKTHTKLNELSQQLREKLAGAEVAVDLNDVFAKTAAKLQEGKSKAFGDNSAIARVLESLKSEVDAVAPEGRVDLIEATNVKRGAGNKGAWSYNRPEPDASAIERVYNEFYDVLKNEIERTAPEGVKEINKALSELIPIQNAALRRLPVEQRNNVLSLTESIGLFSTLFDPKALLIVGASKAAKSGRVGDLLVKTGRKLQKKKP
ncbi:MAG: hypothetical protein KGZ73_05220 [Rhizobiales bacterium]|nr:hypothetical protein [Hyphomicrobiales bacterium]